MTKEQFRNKYRETKMYLNGCNEEVINKLKKAGYFTNNKQSSPFTYIEGSAIIFDNRLAVFNDDPFKEVSVQDFLDDFICDFDEGDIVIYRGILYVVTSIYENSFMLSSIQDGHHNKFSVIVSGDISKKVHFATDEEKKVFIQKILS